MAPKLNHPFFNGLKDFPSGKKKDMQKIRAWVSAQPHLPEMSDEYLILFLHACYYSQDKTKSAIENYFSIRANHPAVFGNRDINSPKVQTIFDLGNCFMNPGLELESLNRNGIPTCSSFRETCQQEALEFFFV